MLDANKDAKTPFDEEDEFYVAAWKDVLDLIVQFHAEVVTQSIGYGRIVAPHCLKKIAGARDDTRKATQRLALRLYGYWLIDPSQAKEWFKEWVDDEFDADVPEGSVYKNGKLAYDL